MKLKNYIKYSILSLGLTLISGLIFPSCRDDLALDKGPIELGEKVHATISVPLDLPAASQVTRANVDFSSSAVMKIDNYWIGLYDTYTGELIGSKKDRPRKETDGNRFTINGSSGTHAIDNIEIYYYSKHPEAYVVGVVNFDNINGKIVGSTESKSMAELLSAATTWEDFCKIAVDTQSADDAIKKEPQMPILMGYYTVGKSSIHPTVNPSNYSVSGANVATTISDKATGIGLTEGGSIKLMRLLSEINVKVGSLDVYAELQNSIYNQLFPGQNPPPLYIPSYFKNMKISNLKYKVVNNPKNIFLAERATDTQSYFRNSEDEYLKFTANSADLEGMDGFYETEWIPVEGNSFTYQVYENKHWGNIDFKNLDWLPSELISSGSNIPPYAYDEYSGILREKTYGFESSVIRILSPEENKGWNSSAPYFIIKADLEYDIPEKEKEEFWEKEYGGATLTGSIEFSIHEGYNSDSNGEYIYSTMPKSDQERNSLITKAFNDYQRIRNTRYNYYVCLGGMETLIYQGEASQWDDSYQHRDHFDGLGGKLRFYVPSRIKQAGTKYSISGNDDDQMAVIPIYNEILDEQDLYVNFYKYDIGILWEHRDQLKWRYLVKTLNGEKNFGNWQKEDNEVADGLPAFPSGGIDPDCPNELLNSYKILLLDIESDDRDHYYPLDSEYNLGAKILKEWNIQDFINASDEEMPSDVLSNDKYVLALYISDFEVEPEVTMKDIDNIYRNFYFKIPYIYNDPDNCTTSTIYFGFEQKAEDPRKKLTDYQITPRTAKYADDAVTSDVGFHCTPGTAALLTWQYWYWDDLPLYYLIQIDDREPIQVEASKIATRSSGTTNINNYPLKVDTDISLGYHDIIITPVFDPEKYQPCEPKALDHPLIVCKNEWNLMDAIQATAYGDYYYYFSSYSNSNYSFNANWGPIIYNGLRIKADRSKIMLIQNPYIDSSSSDYKNPDYWYFQTQGAGSIDTRCFSLYPNVSGTFKVRASWTGSSAPDPDRYINLISREGTLDSQKVTSPSNNPGYYYLRTPDGISEPTEMAISGTNSLRVYSIEFIPD